MSIPKHSKPLNLQEWYKLFGKLPKGFFLEIDGEFLNLYYNGPGFETMIELGGKRPKKGSGKACIGYCSGIKSRPPKKVVQYLKEGIKVALRELSGH